MTQYSIATFRCLEIMSSFTTIYLKNKISFTCFFSCFDLALFVSFLTRLWDFLEVHEDERTGEEYTIFVLEESDSESD